MLSHPWRFGALTDNLQVAHVIIWQQLPAQTTNPCGPTVCHYTCVNPSFFTGRRTKFNYPGPAGLHLVGACELHRTARKSNDLCHLHNTRD